MSDWHILCFINVHGIVAGSVDLLLGIASAAAVMIAMLAQTRV